MRLPGLGAGLAGRDDDRFVGDDAARVVALFERCGVDEGFEAGTWLAPGLGDVVELVAVEIEAAD